MNTALLVIDVQTALCTGDEAAFDIQRIIERINAVAAKARAVGAPVFVIQHEDDGPLQHGSEGWQLDARLSAQPDDISLRKTACDSFHHTELQALLQARGVEQLVVCGLQSDFCIDSTVRARAGTGLPGGAGVRCALHHRQRRAHGGADLGTPHHHADEPR